MENLENLERKPYKYWYLPLLSGLFFVAGGFWIFKTPVASYITLSMLFIAMFLVSGIFEIINALSNTRHSNWNWNLVGGIINFAFGLILLNSPRLSLSILPLYIGFIILFRSVMSIGHAISLKQMGTGLWKSPLVFGILGILFSLLMIYNPIIGKFTIVFYTALSIILFGVVQIMSAFALRKIK
jgi:uncharacterized membrane protein HdeD (DUF308 family)